MIRRPSRTPLTAVGQPLRHLWPETHPSHTFPFLWWGNSMRIIGLSAGGAFQRSYWYTAAKSRNARGGISLRGGGVESKGRGKGRREIRGREERRAGRRYHRRPRTPELADIVEPPREDAAVSRKGHAVVAARRHLHHLGSREG